jgi:hypothetical protein
MLMPKKVKYRKQQRGRRKGKAWRGSSIAFGQYGLKALEAGWLTDKQIEAARVAVTRFIKRGGLGGGDQAGPGAVRDGRRDSRGGARGPAARVAQDRHPDDVRPPGGVTWRR